MNDLNTSAVNIGMQERKIRRVLGVLFIVGIFVFAYLFVRNEMELYWSLILLVVSYQGVRFMYDYTTGTCPLKAELGQSKLDGFITILGTKIDNQNLIFRIRTKSRKALLKSVSVAIVFTLLAIVLRINKMF